MTTGIVFDIQKFSLYDGPGIRTTIFLKGCPLKCLWCHNPESQCFNVQLSYKSKKCVLCGTCALVCPTGAHEVLESCHKISYDKCIACGKCVEDCSYGALKFYGKEMTAEEVINEAAKDIKYYEKSGGGITISGGEPLAQPKFTLEILKAAKDKGIHTCIETSGYAPTDIFEKLLPNVDVFFFDYKASDWKSHEELTGVSSKLILHNLQFIYEKGAEIILRCPLIPGINDSEEHLKKIADMEQKYPMLKGIEVLPYHDMGKGKYKELGRKYKLQYMKNTEEKMKEAWMDFFKALECKKIKII